MMSSGGKNRKNKPARSGSRTKPSSQNSIAACDGVYGNPRLVHSLISLVGSKCTTQVKNGGIYNGIFHTFSPNMDFVLGAAHKIEMQENEAEPASIYSVKPVSIPEKERIVDQLIFKSKDVVCAILHDVDLNYAKAPVKSNGDTNELRTNGSSETKHLELWDGGGDSVEIGGLEDDLKGTGNGTNGWAAEDMFKLNTDKYGVKSSYDPNLPEYTTKLEDEDTKEYAEKLARADKLANEIEKSSSYQSNINMEIDDSITEEERFSSVSRDIPKSDRERNNPSSQRFQTRRVRSTGRPTHQINQHQGGAQRSSGGGPPPSSGYGLSSGRSNTPTNQSDSPTSPGGNRPGFGRTSSGGSQTHVPPRFNKAHPGHTSYPREEERTSNRLHDNTSFHSSQKSRQGGNQSRGYNRNHPSPTSEFTHLQVNEAQNQPPSQQQSISRTSSSSSITQQSNSPQWGSKQPPAAPVPEPQHIHNPMPMGLNQVAPGVGQPQRYPQAAKGIISVKAPAQKPCIVPRILVRNPKLAKEDEKGSDNASSYSNVLQGAPPPNKQGVSQTGIPQIAGGGYNNPRMRPHPGVRYAYIPKGHSPPGVPSQVPGGMMRPQQQHQQSAPIIAPNVPPPLTQRFVQLAQGSQPTTPPVHPFQQHQQSNIRSARSVAPTDESKPKKKPESTFQELVEFGRDFKLQESKSVSDGPKTVSKSSSTGSSSTKVQPRPLRPASNQTTPHHIVPTEQQHQQPQQHQQQDSQHQQPKTTQQQTPPTIQQLPPPQQQQIPAQHPHNSPQIPLQILTTGDQDPGMFMPVIPGHPQPQQMIPIVVPGGVYGSPNIGNTAMAPTSHPIPTPAINVVSSARTSAVAPAVNTISAAKGFVSPQHTTGPVNTGVDTQQHTDGDAVVLSGGDVGLSTTKDGAAPQTPESAPQLNPDAKEFTPRSFAPKPPTPQQSPTPVAHQVQPTQPTYFTAQPIPQNIFNKQLNHKRVPNPTVLSPNAQDPHLVGHMTPQIHTTTAGHAYIGHSPYSNAPIIIAAGAHQPITAPPPQQYEMYPIHHQVAPRNVPYSADGQVYIQQHQQQHQQQQQVQQQQMQQPPQQQQTGYIQQQTRPQSAHTPNAGHIPPTSPASNTQQAQQQQLATVGQGTVPVNPPGPPQLHPPPQNMIAQQYNYQIAQHHPGQHSLHGNQIMPSSPHGGYSSFSQRFYVPPTNPQHQHVTHSPAGQLQQGYIQQNVGSNPGQMQPNQGQMYQVQRPHYHPPQMIQQQQYQQQPN